MRVIILQANLKKMMYSSRAICYCWGLEKFSLPAAAKRKKKSQREKKDTSFFLGVDD